MFRFVENKRRHIRMLIYDGRKIFRSASANFRFRWNADRFQARPDSFGERYAARNEAAATGIGNHFRIHRAWGATTGSASDGWHRDGRRTQARTAIFPRILRGSQNGQHLCVSWRGGNLGAADATANGGAHQ